MAAARAGVQQRAWHVIETTETGKGMMAWAGMKGFALLVLTWVMLAVCGD